MSPVHSTVLVTGAAGALGRHVAQSFLKRRWSVIGTHLPGGHSPEAGEAGVRWLAVDLADPSSVREALQGLEVEALVHCAGGFRYSPVEKLQDGDLDFLIRTNLLSSFYLARELAPRMRRRDSGSIVFVGAAATQRPGAGMGAYCASKAALNMLTQSLQEELKDTGVRINCVLPSIIDTPANRQDMPQADFSKWVSPGTLAEMIAELTVSPWSTELRGAIIPVSGKV